MSRSYNHYLETERKLLLAAVLKNVPSYGWTEKAIIQGADDAGFDDDVRSVSYTHLTLPTKA